MVNTRFWAYTHTSSNTMLCACPPPGYACTYVPHEGNVALRADAEDMMHCLQVMIGPDTSHQASGEANAPVDSLSSQTLKECDDLLARLGTPESQLASHMREYFGQENKSMTKAGQGRVDRFRGPRKLDECKADADDGYISEDDCVAVLYDMTPKGPKKQSLVYKVFYGNVTKVTYDKAGKRVPGVRAHLLEASGEAVCKWFDPVLRDDGITHKPYGGKKAYHLKVDNATGFNDVLEFETILTAVRMTLDKAHDCWLLDSEDFEYAECQKDRWAKYHNGTAAARKKVGPWKKDIRLGHDKRKTKLGRQLRAATSR